MEKIIEVSALTDQLKILLWDRSKTREELTELVIGLIEEAGQQVVRNKEEQPVFCTVPNPLDCPALGSGSYCFPWCEHLRERRESDND